MRGLNLTHSSRLPLGVLENQNQHSATDLVVVPMTESPLAPDSHPCGTGSSKDPLLSLPPLNQTGILNRDEFTVLFLTDLRQMVTMPNSYIIYEAVQCRGRRGGEGRPGSSWSVSRGQAMLPPSQPLGFPSEGGMKWGRFGEG